MEREAIGGRIWLIGMVLGALFAAGLARAGTIDADVPASVEADGRYLIYLHGKIIEDKGPAAVHKRYGRYAYDDILAAFAERGFHVIAEVRGPVNPAQYAKQVAGQVQALIEGGTKPGNIAVVGYSKGGAIAIAAATKVAAAEVRYVILAGCGIGGRDRTFRQVAEDAGRIRGRLFSLYDQADDEAGTCGGLFDAAGGAAAKDEKVLSTGQGHGVFYAPRSDWLDPVTAWLAR